MKTYSVLLLIAAAALSSPAQLVDSGGTTTNEIIAALARLQQQIPAVDISSAPLFVNAPDQEARLAQAAQRRQESMAARQKIPQEIEGHPSGAIARFGSHQVIFSANSEGGIEFFSPDGLRLRSHVVGLCYWTENKTVMVAELKSSSGQIVSASTVLYPDAFKGASADIIYEYTRSSFEQNVVIRKQLPTPSECGFTDAEIDQVRLAVITEFFDPVEPRRAPLSLDLSEAYRSLGMQRSEMLPDEMLSFGAVRIVAGKSFSLGETDLSVPSGKAWRVFKGPGDEIRRYLIESTPYRLLKSLLDALPVRTASKASRPSKDLKTALAQVSSPSEAKADSKLMAKAQTSIRAQPGVVLDYLMVTTPLLNIDFGAGNKSGFAAFGQQSTDFWNAYYYTGSEPGSLTNLYWSDNESSTVGIIVTNGAGLGTNPFCLDPMYQDFIHPQTSGSITLLITNLPPDEYDLVVYAARASGPGAPSIELKRAGTSLSKKGTTIWGDGWFSTAWAEGDQYVRFRNIAVTNQTLQLISYPDSAGWASFGGVQIVPSSSLPSEQPIITRLLNVDLASYSTNKTGVAAVGLGAQDFWNGYVHSSVYAAVETNLKWSDQTNSSVGMIVRNAPGAWGYSTFDPMQGSYIYSPSSGNLTVLFTNLPPGICDVFLYGHGTTADDCSIFELWSDQVCWGVKGTSRYGYAPLSNRWEVGQQYVRFQNVTIANGVPLVIHSKHNTYGYDSVSGIQIAYTGDVDTDADGLPDGWERNWFGDLNQTAGVDPDADGLTNLREYRLALDPTRYDSDADGTADWQDNDFTWLEDAVPQGGIATTSGGDNWTWVSSWNDGVGWNGATVTPHSGQKLVVSANTTNTMHQHIFNRSVAVLRPGTGDVLYAWVNLDPAKPPSEVMLQFYTVEDDGTNSWEHRAYWGSNLISSGTNNTASRYPMGSLPTTNQWVRLEVPASVVGLEGRIIEGMAFTLYSGRAAWDSAGIIVPDMDADGLPDAWENQYFGNLSQTPAGDYDNDGLSNQGEYTNSTHPGNPDTDSDGLSDGEEIAGATDPKAANPPAILQQPQSQSVGVGNNATFGVTMTGSVIANYRYQWRSNAVAIVGATNSTVTLSNVIPSFAASYSAVVTNVAGSVTSSNASLTVTCMPLASGLAAWWQAESNALDNIEGLAGTLSTGAAYTTGKVGTAFSFDGTNGLVQVPSSATLQPDVFTIETWVKFNSLDSARSGSAWAGIQFVAMKQTPQVTHWGSYSLDKNRGGGGDYFEFNVTSASDQNVWVQSSPAIQTGVWYHIAGVRGSNFIQLYVNGQFIGQSNVVFAQEYGGQPFCLGSSGNPQFDAKLKGQLDEVALHHRVLSANEISNIYQAGSLGRCPPPLSVTIASPVAGDTLTTPVQPLLSVRVLGQVASVTNVSLFANGQKLADIPTGQNGWYSMVWSNPPVNNHALTAVAFDNHGLGTTSSVVSITVNSGTFVRGVNLNGNDVAIEGNTWLSFQQATNDFLTVGAGASPLVRSNVLLAPPVDTNAQHMLETMLMRPRLPSTNVPIQFAYAKPVPYDRTVTLSNVPPGFMVTNLAYRAWCVEYNTSDPVGAYQARLYYSCGFPSDPRFPKRSYNKVNYILNNKTNASLKDIQLAIWTVLGTDPATLVAPDNTNMYGFLTNQAALYGADFVPGPDQIAGVILEATNAAMAQPILIEVPGTNLPVGFSLTQGLTNGNYSVYFWLMENEASHMRSLDLKVQGTTVATNTGDLSLGQWRRLGSFAASVTNGTLAFDIISPTKGDPLLMGFAIYAAGAATNQAPSVSFLSPTNNQLFVFAPTNILLSATVSNAVGSITGFSFHTNGVLLANVSGPPYQYLWQGAQPGPYSITASVTNDAGQTASTNVSITNNAPPTVVITWPTNVLSFQEVTNVTLSVTNFDTDGTITQVQLFWRSNSATMPLATISNPSAAFTFTWSNRPAGIYPVIAEATDNCGATTVSPIRVFRVLSTNTPPEVWITSPTNGAVFKAGTDFAIGATATNTNGVAIASVEFFRDNIRLAGDAAVSYETLVSGLMPGMYQFTARVTDSNGLASTSTNVTITVQDWETLSADGQWDPAFQLAGWDEPFRYSLRPRVQVGSAGQVYSSVYTLLNLGRIHVWEGCTWTLGLDLDAELKPYGLCYHEDKLYVTGVGTNEQCFVRAWDGTNVTDLTLNLDGEPRTMEFIQGDLIAGGRFSETNSQTYYGLAKLVGATWVMLGGIIGETWADEHVLAVARIGDDLFIGGEFSSVGGDTNVAYVARLVGTNWVALGSGVNGTVRALAVWNGQLLVGGDFTSAGGDTNALGLAKWDGAAWSPLGGALGLREGRQPDSFGSVPRVESMLVYGNSVFVGGAFDTVRNGPSVLESAAVAHLRWRTADQSWTWSAMDRGVSLDPNGPHSTHPTFVDSLALRPRPGTNGYDVIAGGFFDQAGMLPSTVAARWMIAANDCTNARPPSVYWQYLLNGKTYNNTSSLDLSAIATADTNAQIEGVAFYADGVFIGNGINYGGTSPYSFTWDAAGGLTNGVHRLDAIARDSQWLTNKATVVIAINTNAGTLTAQEDAFDLLVNAPATNLNVLDNDSTTTGNARHVVSASQIGNANGTVSVSHDNTTLVYSFQRDAWGNDLVAYSVTDGVNTNSALANIRVHSPPAALILAPAGGAELAAGTNIVVTVQTFDNDGAVTNVVLKVNDSQFAETTNAAFSFAWSNSTPGFYTFLAIATDNEGYTNASAPVTIALTNTFTSTNVLIASIDSLTNTITNVFGMSVTNFPVVREGLITNFLGKAREASGAATVTYQLLLFEPGNEKEPVANVTPGALNSQGFHIGGDTAGKLGSLDLTVVANGVYDLRLTVRAGGAETNATARFMLDSNLKIGQFSFSEQDLVIPVSGIPLTVTRTYNSLTAGGFGVRQSSGAFSTDFGPGWTMALNSMDVQLDETRETYTIGAPGSRALMADVEEDENRLPLDVSIRTGGNWDVTLTLPEGRRATFIFAPRLVPEESKAYARWQAPPGVNATLAVYPPGHDELPYYPWLHWGDDDGSYSVPPLENHDIPRWVLTNQDGTVYLIERDQPNNVVFDTSGNGTYAIVRAFGPPRLTRIEQRSGDVIEIGSWGIQHKAQGTNLTRSVWFERDDAGRISAIRDPISGSNGLPVLRYIYHEETGNLLQVHRLVNRTTGACLTNRYHYDHPKFPHYITSIEDARGIPVARNLYSDDGRLIGIIDSAGRTNTFEHNLSNRVEIVRDRSGIPTSYYYDSKGNVTDIANVYGHTNHIEYRDDGAVLSHTDPLGRTTTFSNDEQGNVLAVTVPHLGTNSDSYTTRYTYDSSGNQSSVTLPTGAVITNLFDGAGRLQEVRDGTNLISRTDFDSVTGHEIAQIDRFGTNRFAYDDMGNCVRLTNSLGGVVYSGFDPNGNLTALTNDNQASSFQYDAQNRETVSDFGEGITLTNNYGTDSDWTSVDAPTIGHMERHFDDQGRLAGWSTVNEAEPGFAYDVNGRLEYETNSIGVVTHTTYDLIGRAVGVTNLATGAGTTYDFDPANQRVGTTNALGGWTRFGYHVDGSLAASTNSRGYYWTYTNSTAGSCCGASTSGTVTDPLGRQVISLLSASGLPMETIRQATNGVSRTNKTTYLAGMVSPDQEAEEYPETITDEGGRTRRFAYTEFGQLEQATDLSGNTWWTNQYDPESGALLFVISPTRETNAYFYDDLDNIRAIRFPDGGSLTNYYNAENRLNGVRLPSGVTLSNLYDFAGRVTNRTARANSVVVENANFAYDLNDAVTIMTDNTGGTTNLYDPAGRLYGIDYPSGASVRYQHDLLDRITNVIAKASPSGTNYSTRYQYDSVGNLTNIIDPFNRQISFDFDAVNRKRKRTLPNGVVTTYDYNDFDQVTKIEHKKDSTVLARFEYERNTGGEPTKITREDGSWVELQYDAALRLTSEVYKTSGGGLSEEISYGYDASGSRVRLVKGTTILTNSVAKGYQVQAVTNETTGVEAERYAFDSGGRMTVLSNEVHYLKLGYNSADQVTAVTNGTSTAWVTYRHDATGRRTASTNNAGVVRKFVVAPTPNTDLESPVLVADASGNVQQGYVYIGYQPLLRFDGAGNPVYYLEDSKGSVAALADTNGNKSASFSYDGFGNVRNASGTTSAPVGAAGDFRFHGAWLEEGTGLYNMRAREYDARTGRFTSRDPVGGDFKAAETQSPYLYGLNNPVIYCDPSGEFSLVELNVVSAQQFTLATFKTAATQYAKARARREIASAFSSFVGSQIQGFLGFDWAKAIAKIVGEAENGFDMGNLFGKKGQQILCKTLGKIDGMEDQIHSSVRVSAAGSLRGPVGTPLTRGRDCQGRPGLPESTGWSVGIPYGIPDFIIGDKPIADTLPPLFNQALLVGDFKWSTKAFHDEYAAKHPRNPQQYSAVIGYARRHTYMHTALFIVGHNKAGLPGGKANNNEMTRIKALAGKTMIKQQVLPVIMILVE